MSTVAVNGFEMHVETWEPPARTGEAPAPQPLLLLHGGTGIGEDWRLIFPANPPGFRAIVPDLRGHGRSTNPSGPFTFRQCALDVLALLDGLAVPSVAAIGLSLGAKTLLHVATLQPDRVSAMVLVSATPRFLPGAKAAMAQFTPGAFDALSPEARDALRARHVHGDAQIRGLYALIAGFATRDDDMAFDAATLGTIRARTLVVQGDRDPLYPVEQGVELYRGIPGSALWVVPQGGHGPIFGDAAPRFAATALAFLGAGQA